MTTGRKMTNALTMAVAMAGLVFTVTSTQAALVLHYDFASAPGGVVADVSGFGSAKDLSLSGDATIVSDPDRGNVLSLDGSGDYGATAACTAGDKLDTMASLTLMAWIKTDTTSRSFIVGKSTGPSYWMEINTTGHAGKATAHVGGPGTETYSTTSVNDNTWRHVAMTHDGSTLSIFVDGAFETSFPAAVTDLGQVNPFHVGTLRTSDPDARFFNGLIDDVRVYNGVLTEAEIAAIAFPPLRGTVIVIF